MAQMGGAPVPELKASFLPEKKYFLRPVSSPFPRFST